MMARRGIQGQGRRLPPTPNKPSTLKLQPANINFPKLNASPTRVSYLMNFNSTVIINKFNDSFIQQHTTHRIVFTLCLIRGNLFVEIIVICIIEKEIDIELSVIVIMECAMSFVIVNAKLTKGNET